MIPAPPRKPVCGGTDSRHTLRAVQTIKAGGVSSPLASLRVWAGRAGCCSPPGSCAAAVTISPFRNQRDPPGPLFMPSGLPHEGSDPLVLRNAVAVGRDSCSQPTAVAEPRTGTAVRFTFDTLSSVPVMGKEPIVLSHY